VLKLLLCCLLLLSCQQQRPDVSNKLPDSLPQPLTNHAVAALTVDGQPQIYSFNGLRAGKGYQDITNQATVWRAGQWHTLSTPLSQPPVLASVAVAVGEAVYLFGGYTVAPDHSELSVPNVWKIDARTDRWQALPPMPTPVDDTVALVYQQRYIYLISGWHDVDNVALVQVLDTVSLTWQQATPYPLPPVFGHAGAMIGHQMVICDGVKVSWSGEKKSFSPSPACALGEISVTDPTKIAWQTIPHHSGVAYYRMAATDDGRQRLVFAAGSDNPYNYNGIGYNQEPAAPSGDLRIYNLQQRNWEISHDVLSPTMDHRSLLRLGDQGLILGGMLANQKVHDGIIYFPLLNKE